MKVITHFLISIFVVTNVVFAQDYENTNSSLDIGYASYGLSFGNSKVWNGIRFNISDDNIYEINGLNITFWQPENISGSQINGIAFGLAPSAGDFNGITLGIGNVAENNIKGINIGVLA